MFSLAVVPSHLGLQILADSLTEGGGISLMVYPRSAKYILEKYQFYFQTFKGLPEQAFTSSKSSSNTSTRASQVRQRDFRKNQTANVD